MGNWIIAILCKNICNNLNYLINLIGRETIIIWLKAWWSRKRSSRSSSIWKSFYKCWERRIFKFKRFGESFWHQKWERDLQNYFRGDQRKIFEQIRNYRSKHIFKGLVWNSSKQIFTWILACNLNGISSLGWNYSSEEF